jgi:hypothetical protein
MKNKLLKIVICFILGSFFVNSQVLAKTIENTKSYKIKGKIIDQNTKEPLIGATIFIKEYKTGTATDINGEFLLRLPKGKYSLTYSYVGYQAQNQSIKVTSNMEFTVRLVLSSKEIEDVLVSATRKNANVVNNQMSVEKLKMKNIKAIPALMGEVDVIKAIQLLPGVQATSEGASGFSVRGGNFDQNLVVLDEAPIHNPSHLMGFFSVFNNDIVKDIELYKGDIPVSYGGKLSSLLQINTKDGDPLKIKGSGGIGTISSRLAVSGPIIPGKLTFVAGARRSYADILLAGWLKLRPDPDLEGTKLHFYDLNGKLTYKPNRNNTLIYSGYTGNDIFGNDLGEFGYSNTSSSFIWKHTYNEHFATRVTAFYSKYDYLTASKAQENSSVALKSYMQDISVKIDNTYLLDSNNTMKFGVSVINHEISPLKLEPLNSETRKSFSEITYDEKYSLEWGAYVSNDQKIGENLNLKYGLRFSLFQNVGPGKGFELNDNYELTKVTSYSDWEIFNVYQGLEPRISGVYKIDEKQSVKAGYSRTRQYMHLASNSSGGNPLNVWFVSNNNIKPQLADQFAVGYFRNFFFDQIETSVELYYKDVANTIDFKDHAQLIFNDTLDREVRVGKSYSYGAEFMVRLNMDKWSGWVSYTLSRTLRDIPEINKGEPFLSPYDKPHDISIVGNYQINDQWSVSANWVYASGNLMTIPIGAYLGEDGYTTIPIYGKRNDYRMPDYHRLDVGVTYKNKKKEGKRWESEWNLSVYNAYARKNPWTITFVNDELRPGAKKAQMTYLFSILPSITYNFKF